MRCRLEYFIAFSLPVSVSPALWRGILGKAVKDSSFLSIQLPGAFQTLSGTRGKCYYSAASKVSVGDLVEEGRVPRRISRKENKR